MPSKQACPAPGAFAFLALRGGRCEAILEEKSAACCKNLF